MGWSTPPPPSGSPWNWQHPDAHAIHANEVSSSCSASSSSAAGSRSVGPPPCTGGRARGRLRVSCVLSGRHCAWGAWCAVSGWKTNFHPESFCMFVRMDCTWPPALRKIATVWPPCTSRYTESVWFDPPTPRCARSGDSEAVTITPAKRYELSCAIVLSRQNVRLSDISEACIEAQFAPVRLFLHGITSWLPELAVNCTWWFAIQV